MVYINLLPIREIKKRIRAKQQLSLYAITLVSVLAVLGAVWLYQTNIISGLNSEISALEQEKQRYTNILKQIAKLEADKKLIESKIAVIKQLQKTKAITVHVLDEVAKLTPSKRIWLKTISQSGFSLNLTGMALDNQTIASYMDKLTTSEYITDVNLISSTSSTYAGRDLKAFTLTCSLKLPEATVSKAETGTKP